MGELSRSELAALQTIRDHRQITRGDIAATLSLSQAMTARLITRLQATGLVREAGPTVSAGPGRQALLLELHPESAYVVGVDIGGEVLHVLVADAHGVARTYRETPSTLLTGKTQAEIVVAVADLVRDAVEEADVPLARIGAVGVAVTGIIDSDSGICLVRSNTPGWDSFPLAAYLSEALGLPVMLEETARAKSVAELRIGAAQGAEHFLYVEASLAIGASIVIHRQPFRGVSGLAGELGHIAVDPNGELCRCGNLGCVQATASARALVARAGELLHRGVYSSLSAVGGTLTLADIAAAAGSGDKMALELLTQSGERLGEAISMGLNLLGLDLVVMGGRLAQCSPVVMDAAQRMMRLRVLPLVSRERTLVHSTLGSDAAARGVAFQAIDWLLTEPSARILDLIGRISQITTAVS